VGSISVSVTLDPCLKFAFRCKQTIESWETQVPEPADVPVNPATVSASTLYRHSRVNPPNRHAGITALLFAHCTSTNLPEEYGTVEFGSYEFWTVIFGALEATEERHARSTTDENGSGGSDHDDGWETVSDQEDPEEDADDDDQDFPEDREHVKNSRVSEERHLLQRSPETHSSSGGSYKTQLPQPADIMPTR
jgi:hypothetical protein